MAATLCWLHLPHVSPQDARERNEERNKKDIKRKLWWKAAKEEKEVKIRIRNTDENQIVATSEFRIATILAFLMVDNQIHKCKIDYKEMIFITSFVDIRAMFK
jgi:hypothetical protein